MVLQKIDHSTLFSQVISFLMHPLFIMSRRATLLQRPYIFLASSPCFRKRRRSISYPFKGVYSFANAFCTAGREAIC